MPVLGKHTLTRYLGSDCQKQLRILLSPDTGPGESERERNGMPPKQPPLPGLNAIAQAGDEWAATRLAELDTILGSSVLVGTRKNSTRTSGIEFTATPLAASLPTAVPHTFLAEHQFTVGPTFEREFGVVALKQQYALTIDDLRPDLIQVRGPGECARYVLPDGSVEDLPAGDARRQLRVIDIKLTAQPGPGYLAEVVYYSVALAGWLEDSGLDDQFVVCPNPAIWPGSHEASALATAQKAARASGEPLTVVAGLTAIEEDLEEAPLPVFVSRLHHFFQTTLPEVLGQPWDTLPFHVTSRCRGCDFLGQEWGSGSQVDDRHCMPTAKATEHLSQIAFVSRGASQLLSGAGLGTVGSIAGVDARDPAFDLHHSLRGQRTVISSRAQALHDETVGGVAPRAGTSAVLPRWSDLNVYLTADFDASSAITLAFGVTAFWMQPTAYGAPRRPDRPRKVWNRPKTFLVDSKDLRREEAVLLEFLGQIDSILEYVATDDANRGGTASTVQFYLWDDLTYRHLCRVVGRHLEAILAQRNGLRSLVWLFPPEEVLGNDRLLAEPALTIVGDTVRSLLALPIPHHYSLLETARRYHSAGLDPKWAAFEMPRFYEDRLSDQIPSERAHDIWGRGPRYTENVRNLDWAVGRRLQALEEVTKRLRADLGDQLRRQAPRRTSLTPPPNVARLTADELLLLAYTRLNAAVDAQEIARRRAMPPHEREARFVAARLTARLTGPERSDAFARLGMTARPTLEVYTVRDGSDQANFKDGDFLCAVVPEDQVEILDWSVGRLITKRTGDRSAADAYGADQRTLLSEVLNATLVRFDREQRLAVVEMTTFAGRDHVRRRLLSEGFVSLDRHVSLEKVHKDYFSRKLQKTLTAIGRTPKAVASPVAARALGRNLNPRATASKPVEDVLWDAEAMAAAPVDRDAAAAEIALLAHRRDLNDSQWDAFHHALTHRLTLLWGPPGTGKSRTVTNIITGAAHDAVTRERPLRVLVSSSTYSAIDNVLDEVAVLAGGMLPEVQVWRCRGDGREQALPPVRDCLIEAPAGPDQQALAERLTAPGTRVTVVGASPQQIHKLADSLGGPATGLFDLIVIDEASQIDVAGAVLPLATLAEGGAVVIAGDPLQLPPIHGIDPPKGTEHLVGSIYDYLAEHLRVPAQRLLVNYRSNAEIVALARDADYPAGLHAHSPRLRMNLLSPVPTSATAPSGWPAHLPWTPLLADLLDPDRPVTCLVHRDGLSGQSSEFEAQIVAGLAWLLGNRLADQLTGEKYPDGAFHPDSTSPYTVDLLFRTGLGVVTPHRAQQSLVTRMLTQTLPAADPAAIRGAVDTVERFQGQQRDVIVASYAVGDPDTIAEEDEFLQSLNRFNVMASRARAKIIVLVSEELIQHLPTDLDVLRASRLVKAFADIRCRHRRTVSWPVDTSGTVKAASLRWS